MLTDKMYLEMVHDYNNGGITKSYPNLTTFERVALIKHFAKNDPKCSCPLTHKEGK
jgi:hypothetical protein